MSNDPAPARPDDSDPVHIWLADCHRTLGRMPYGAGVHFLHADLSNRLGRPATSNAELARILADNLNRLAVGLGRVAETNNAVRVELADLRRQVAGLDELADSIARYQAARLTAALEDGDGEWDGTLPGDVTVDPAPVEAGS